MYSHFSSTEWVTPFGLIFVVAIAVAWWLARRNAVSIGIDGSHIDLLVPVTIITGIAGGTMIAIFMPMDHMVAGAAMDHGVRIRLFGMLGTGAIALFVYSRITELSFRRLLDCFALPTLAGLMLHRFGCFMAGCCWGDVAGREPVANLAAQVQTLPFLGGLVHGVQYPPGSLPYEQHAALGLIEPGAVASLPIYPVQLYEACLLGIGLVLLSRLSWRRFPRGMLAVIVVCCYAAMRFFIEYLRADGSIVLGNLTVTQLQCIVLLACAALLPGMRRQYSETKIA